MDTEGGAASTIGKNIEMDEDRLRAVFKALAEHEVKHAVFGAVALGLHGLARATAALNDPFRR